eukprot:13593414-Alexandrium_andersonii.AAC.1
MWLLGAPQGSVELSEALSGSPELSGALRSSLLWSSLRRAPRSVWPTVRTEFHMVPTRRDADC